VYRKGRIDPSFPLSFSMKPMWNARPFLRARRATNRRSKPSKRSRPTKPPATIPATAPVDKLRNYQLMSQRQEVSSPTYLLFLDPDRDETVPLEYLKIRYRSLTDHDVGVPSAERGGCMNLRIIDREFSLRRLANFTKGQRQFMRSSAHPCFLEQHGPGMICRFPSGEVDGKPISVHSHSIRRPGGPNGAIERHNVSFKGKLKRASSR
jgi:hypothetical protein